jgi:tetratricopeptide (TPR) repeat protein
MAHYRLGMAKKKAGDRLGAGKEFMTAVHANPALCPALNELGLISLGEGDYIRAFDYFSDAAEADTTFSDAYYNMAGIRMNMGKYASAAEYYQKYLDFAENPEDSSEVRSRIEMLSSAVNKAGGK